MSVSEIARLRHELQSAALPATATRKGLFTASDFAKLTAIETLATEDQTNSEIEIAYNVQVAAVSQATAEAGTDTVITRWTAEMVKHAIAALETSGSLANIVEDTTPQLGGDLDVNDKKIVAGVSTNIILQLGSTGSSTFFILKDSNGVTQFTINGDGTLNVTGNIITSALIDGRDVAADGTKLNTIEPNANALPIVDSTAVVKDPADATKLGRIDVGALATATTRVISMGDRDVDLASGGTFAEVSHNHAASDITSEMLAIARGGTSAGTAQAAIDTLSAVSGATNEHVLTKDTGTGNAIFKAAAGEGNGVLVAFKFIQGDTGSAEAEGVADSVIMAGGVGITTVGHGTPDTVTFNHDAHTGDVTGATALTIGTDKVVTAKILNSNVTLAKLADLADSTIIGQPVGGGTAPPVALTATQLLALVNAASGTVKHERGGIEADISGAAKGDIIFATAADTLGLVKSDIGAMAWSSGNVSIPNNANTILALNAERWDTDGIHDNSTNNSRLTCRTAGVYIITFSGAFAININGVRQWVILLNGTTTITAVNKAPSSSQNQQTTSIIYKLAVNDYIEMRLFQSSGAALGMSSANHTPNFAMQLIART